MHSLKCVSFWQYPVKHTTIRIMLYVAFKIVWRFIAGHAGNICVFCFFFLAHMYVNIEFIPPFIMHDYIPLNCSPYKLLAAYAHAYSTTSTYNPYTTTNIIESIKKHWLANTIFGNFIFISTQHKITTSEKKIIGRITQKMSSLSLWAGNVITRRQQQREQC